MRPVRIMGTNIGNAMPDIETSSNVSTSGITNKTSKTTMSNLNGIHPSQSGGLPSGSFDIQAQYMSYIRKSYHQGMTEGEKKERQLRCLSSVLLKRIAFRGLTYKGELVHYTTSAQSEFNNLLSWSISLPAPAADLRGSLPAR